MAQTDPEAALQELTGIGTEELLALPADPGFKPRRDRAGVAAAIRQLEMTMAQNPECWCLCSVEPR